MKLADFPQDTIEEILKTYELFKEKNLLEKLNQTTLDLVNLPAETHALGKELKHMTEGWEEELSVHKYTFELLLLLCCWTDTRKRYEEQNISEDIFRRSLHDMYCKVMECRKLYGMNGIFVGYWYDRFFDLSRFALGRIQFELIPYPFDEPVKVKNRWIPEKFISEDGADYPVKMEKPLVFVMDSWLLDPDLQKLLPNGNIKAFTSRFKIIHTQKEEKFEDGWRVFGKEWENEPEKLPIRTSLQKNIAEYLQNDGKLGEAFGILLYEI